MRGVAAGLGQQLGAALSTGLDVGLDASLVAATEAPAPLTSVDRGDREWYKEAIIYQLHIKAFCDANGDGIGDFSGLLHKLNYVQELGVTAIWLLPFYPSPLRDDGYDIADYTAVNPAYGNLDIFKRFVEAAHERGIRVITELVINHTSDVHPWFQRSRRAAPGTPEREFYVWSDQDDRYAGTRIIFIDSEASNWTWDPVAKAYYWHRFYSHQPDLNFDNPLVFAEVIAAMRFWLDIGVDGLRLDAVPYLCEREGTNNENLPETHDVLRRIRSEIDQHYPDRMLLAEANQWPEDTRPYFGEGDECHMAFHFPLMPRMYMALAQEDRHPITDILRQTPEIPESCQWALFLRNHDELTLEMVTDEERDYLWRTYAADPRARLNLGIRRRLAALMDNDRRKIELMNALLMSMPGTPVIYYGDEIGMGDNYYLGDRHGVRTPMQWSIDRNAGFSTADPQRLYLPVLMDALYGYQAVNVESQDKDPSSLLNWMRRMIAVRKSYRAFGRGTLLFLYPRNRRIIAYLRIEDAQRVLCVANLSRSAQAVELDLSEYRGLIPIELGGRSAFPVIGSAPYVITLPAYGFYWFALSDEADITGISGPPEPQRELFTLVGAGWPGLLQGRERRHLEQSVLPSYLPRQRWFADKNTALNHVTVRELAALDGDHVMLAADTGAGDDRGQTYFLPLCLVWNDVEARVAASQASTVARVRRGSSMGAMVDAGRDGNFIASLLARLQSGEDLVADGGALQFRPTAELSGIAPDAPVKLVSAEQSNVSAVIGDAVLLKLYRRLEAGVHPEVEMSRFLTESAHFTASPAYLGSVIHASDGGTETALAVAFRYVQNQGDAWTTLTEALERLLEGYMLAEGDAAVLQTFPLGIGPQIGARTAELHEALACETSNPAFSAEKIARDDILAWVEETRASADKAFQVLAAADMAGWPDATADAARQLLLKKPVAEKYLATLATIVPSGLKTRIHGDYHLGQLLMIKDDVLIIDFEGEPGRTFSERRQKSSPLRDMAGLLRSFDYAAWAALDKLTARGVTVTDVRRELAFQWRDAASERCLNAYRTGLDKTGILGKRQCQDGLLTLFLLHKAFYELRYELGSRPAWVSIPLRGLLKLIQSLGRDL